MARERPKVGVAVFVTSSRYPNCVLAGVRKGSSSTGKLAMPGGHLEYGEEWIECGKREVLEETGLRLKDVHFSTVVNGIDRKEKVHYVVLFLQGVIDENFKSIPENLEPDKCEGWDWYDWDDFPPACSLICPLAMVRQQGYNPFRNHKTSELASVT